MRVHVHIDVVSQDSAGSQFLKINDKGKQQYINLSLKRKTELLEKLEAGEKKKKTISEEFDVM